MNVSLFQRQTLGFKGMYILPMGVISMPSIEPLKAMSFTAFNSVLNLHLIDHTESFRKKKIIFEISRFRKIVLQVSPLMDGNILQPTNHPLSF